MNRLTVNHRWFVIWFSNETCPWTVYPIRHRPQYPIRPSKWNSFSSSVHMLRPSSVTGNFPEKGIKIRFSLSSFATSPSNDKEKQTDFRQSPIPATDNSQPAYVQLFLKIFNSTKLFYKTYSHFHKWKSLRLNCRPATFDRVAWAKWGV